MADKHQPPGLIAKNLISITTPNSHGAFPDHHVQHNTTNDKQEKIKKPQQQTTPNSSFSSPLVNLSVSIVKGTALGCRGLIEFSDRFRCHSSSSIPVTPLIPPYRNNNNNSKNPNLTMNNNGSSGRSSHRADTPASSLTDQDVHSVWTIAAVRSAYAPPPTTDHHRPRATDGNMPIHGRGQHRHRRSSSTATNASNSYVMGNIIKSGTDYKASTAPLRPATDTLGSRTNLKAYGYGSVMWAEMQERQKMKQCDDLDKRGLVQLNSGKLREAFDLFDMAVRLAGCRNRNNINNNNVVYRIHRAEALIKLGEVEVAVRELETVLRMDPRCDTAHHNLAALFLRLGQLENARRHIFVVPKKHHQEQQPEQAMHTQKLEDIGKHLRACYEARKLGDWKKAMKEADAAAHAGADSSPQLLACKVEAILKLNQMYDTKISLPDMPKYSPVTVSSSQALFFGMFSEAYYCFVQSQTQMATGRFQDAIESAEKASQIDPRNAEIEEYLNMLKKMDIIRTCANDLYIAGRFNAALELYDDCLTIDEHNPVVYCNKAACWIKMGKWEQAIDNGTRALRTNPKYIKALLRRALSNARLGRWAHAVADYEVLKMELPKDKQVAEALRNAKTELRKGQHTKYDDGKFDGVPGLYQFRPATSCEN